MRALSRTSFAIIVALAIRSQLSCTSALRTRRALGRIARDSSLEVETNNLLTAKDESNGTDDVQELFVEQRLDHFDETNHCSFAQRYFYTDRFVRPINDGAGRQLSFLCVGGEGPDLSKSVLVDSVHCTGDMIRTASHLFEENPDLSIHLYALEHRYYGKSYPDECFNGTSSVTNENLRYLSSRQALSDIAHFCTVVRRSKEKWITFGSSYPGMLSAWARLKFPHLIGAAISNAAPLEARVNFPEYKGHQAKVLRDPIVGGSELCLSIVKKGHEQLVEAVANTSKHDEIAEALNLCPDTGSHRWASPKNLELLLGDGVYDFDTQDDDPACDTPLCNNQKTCEALITKFKETNSEMDSLAWAVREQTGADCILLDWQNELDYLSDPIRGKVGGWRSWLWQTCTEFGYYQTCERGSDCPFGQGYHLLSQDFELCEVAFGVKANAIVDAVNYHNENYGGWQIEATNILSLTGSVDPWTELALNSNRTKLQVVSVSGASHHFWTHPMKDSDKSDIWDARNIILNQVRQWLGLSDMSLI